MAGDVRGSSQAAGFDQAQDSKDPARPGSGDAPLALYRRYRPATFAEVKGQDHVTAPLRQALRSGRVHHAYLFSGPRGCGKTSSARILARSLNCEQGPTPDPCGVCASCVALSPAGPGSIDVIEIDAASHGGIDDARDLRERAFYSPVAARYKIYIIDEAHMVTGAGFNALLKLVEEPPPHLKFVFATTEPEKVIATIRSRTHHYPFRLVPPPVLRELLDEILGSEGIAYEPSVLPVVIRAGGGSVRDTLSVVDQLIAGSDDSGLRYDRAIALLGYTDDALLDEMADAFAASDGAAVFVAIDHVVEAGHDPRRFAMDLLDRLRDLIVLAAVPGAAASGLLDVPEDRLDRMRGQAARFGQERLVRAAETISNGLVEMRGATSPRLLLELMCAQVLLPAGAPASGAQAQGDGSDVLGRLDRLERQLAGQQMPEVKATHARPARAGAPRPEVTQANAAPAGVPQGGRAATDDPDDGASTGIDAATLRDQWQEVLGAVREVRKTAWILLSNHAAIESVEGNVLTLAFDAEGNAKGFASSGSDGHLADVLSSRFGARPVIRTMVRPGGVRERPGSPAGVTDTVTSEESGAGPGPNGTTSPRTVTGSEGLAGDADTVGGAERTRPASNMPAADDGADVATRSRQTGATVAATSTGAVGQNGAQRGGSRPAGPRKPGAGQAEAGPPAAARQRSAGGSSPKTSRDLAGTNAAGMVARDDPRLDTDPDETGVADGLTGSELIVRELGGEVIEETGEG